jgi:methionyl aminopeptidase
VGEVSAVAKQLMTAAEAALYAGIAQVKPGNTLLDIAGAIEDCVATYGFAVVEDFTGHGCAQPARSPSVFNVALASCPT